MGKIHEVRKYEKKIGEEQFITLMNCKRVTNKMVEKIKHSQLIHAGDWCPLKYAGLRPKEVFAVQNLSSRDASI